MQKIKNVSGLDRDFDYTDDLGRRLTVVARDGDTIEVPDDIAGRPPSDDDLGEGFLAQVDVWQPSSSTPTPTDLLPDGTAKEVLAWVGDDPARAAEALVAENAREAPRSTLVAQLETIAADTEDN